MGRALGDGYIVDVQSPADGILVMKSPVDGIYTVGVQSPGDGLLLIYRALLIVNY
jgi:hypothetical protein